MFQNVSVPKTARFTFSQKTRCIGYRYIKTVTVCYSCWIKRRGEWQPKVSTHASHFNLFTQANTTYATTFLSPIQSAELEICRCDCLVSPACIKDPNLDLHMSMLSVHVCHRAIQRVRACSDWLAHTGKQCITGIFHSIINKDAQSLPLSRWYIYCMWVVRDAASPVQRRVQCQPCMYLCTSYRQTEVQNVTLTELKCHPPKQRRLYLHWCKIRVICRQKFNVLLLQRWSVSQV